MVIFCKSKGKGCVEIVFRKEVDEELPNIEQLMSECSELFGEEDGIDEFEEYSTLEQLEQENPGYFEE